MPKFFVKVKEVHTQVIEVDVADGKSAREAANAVLESGIQQDGSELPDNTEYSFTLDPDEWDVWQ